MVFPLYDILWDDVFERFYIDDSSGLPDYTEEELEAIEEGADTWLMGLVGIL